MADVSPTSIAAGTYKVDAERSEVGFEVRYMALSSVTGSFKQFEGSVEAGTDLTLTGTVDVASVDVGDSEQNAQLQGPTFFDRPRFADITFASTGSHADSDGKLTLTGEITIKGTTKAIELVGALAENGQGAGGGEPIRFDVEGKIDRREFDLKWNQTLPSGDLMIGNEVKLIVRVVATRNA